MLKTFQEHIKDIYNEDMHAMMKHKGISESDYRQFKNKPMALAATDQERKVKKLIETGLHIQNYKTMDGLTSSFTFIYKIYPEMKQTLSMACKDCFNEEFLTFTELVNSIFLPNFLASTLQEIALENVTYKRIGTMDYSYPALCADIRHFVFEILKLEDKTIALDILENTFNPIFYGDTLMYFILEKQNVEC